MIIGVDMDGVIADIHTLAVQLRNETGPRSYTVDDITEWDTPFNEYIFKILGDELLHRRIPVMNDAAKGMATLHEKHEVVIVSSRPKTPTPWILDWLGINGILYHHFINTGHARKGLVRADVLIDDFPGNLDDFPGARLLFERPWNHDSTYARVPGWEAVLKIIDLLDEY